MLEPAAGRAQVVQPKLIGSPWMLGLPCDEGDIESRPTSVDKPLQRGDQMYLCPGVVLPKLAVQIICIRRSQVVSVKRHILSFRLLSDERPGDHGRGYAYQLSS